MDLCLENIYVSGSLIKIGGFNVSVKIKVDGDNTAAIFKYLPFLHHPSP